MRSFKERLFIFFQHIIHHHGLSRVIGKLAQSEIPFLKNFLIERFIKAFEVDMTQALYPTPESYKNFNDFFTRPLKAGARPIELAADALISPADGAISQIGSVDEGQILQAKGRTYSITDLLGGDASKAAPFRDGSFATIYLSPKDYHRVHMPFSGVLKEMLFVPGQLFSVNNTTAENVDNLFARNERVVAIFDTNFGPMAVVLVGAMIVASIETKWHGVVAPAASRAVQVFSYHDKTIKLAKGEELGRFRLGSTAIVVLPKGAAQWSDHLYAGSSVKMGESIGRA